MEKVASWELRRRLQALLEKLSSPCGGLKFQSGIVALNQNIGSHRGKYIVGKVQQGHFRSLLDWCYHSSQSRKAHSGSLLQPVENDDEYTEQDIVC